MDCQIPSGGSCCVEDSTFGEYLNSLVCEDGDFSDLNSLGLSGNIFPLSKLDNDDPWTESGTDVKDEKSTSDDNLTSISPSPSKYSFSELSDSLSPKDGDLDFDNMVETISEEIAGDSINEESNQTTSSRDYFLSVAHTMEIHNYCSLMRPEEGESNSVKPSRFTNKKAAKSAHFTDFRLTEEEKKLLVKEGYELPFGKEELSPQDEKVLRKIRRKIRNKRSAQFSRQRKKLYVEELEKKYKDCADENEDLKKELEDLRKENQSLLTKMMKILQDHSSHGLVSFKTSLCVLILSFLFILIPTFKPDSLDDSVMKSQPEVMNTGRHLLMTLAGHDAQNGTIDYNDSDNILNYINTISIESQSIPLNI